MISADESGQRGRKLGAYACLKKPVTKSALDEAFARVRSFTDRRVRNLLVVEDNEDRGRRRVSPRRCSATATCG